MHKAFADGACRPSPGRGAYGYIIYDDAGSVIKIGNGSAGDNTTNTIAEYTAIIKAMEAALRVGVESLAIYSDSQSAIRQLACDHKIHNKDLKILKTKVDFLQKKFKDIQFIFIPRCKNQVADAIAAEFYRTAGSLTELRIIC